MSNILFVSAKSWQRGPTGSFSCVKHARNNLRFWQSSLMIHSLCMYLWCLLVGKRSIQRLCECVMLQTYVRSIAFLQCIAIRIGARTLYPIALHVRGAAGVTRRAGVVMRSDQLLYNSEHERRRRARRRRAGTEWPSRLTCMLWSTKSTVGVAGFW